MSESAQTSPSGAAPDPLESAAERTSRRRSRFRTAPTVGTPGKLSFPSPFALRDFNWPAALRNDLFRSYWLSQIVALGGMWMQNVGMQLIVLSLTTSAFAFGLINVASAVPLLIFSLVGGVIADKYDRRKINMSMSLLLGSISLIYAFLIFTDRIAYWQIIVLAAIAGTISAFQMPAGQAFVAELVPTRDLPQAMALNSASFNATRIVGPALASTAIGILGLASAFLFNAMTILAPVGTMMRIGRRLPPRQRPKNTSASWSALKEGFSYVRNNDGMWGLVLLQALISFTVSPPILVLMPLYVTSVLGGSNAWVGGMLSVLGAGSLIGAFTLLRGSRLESAASRRQFIALIGLVAGLLWIALSPNTWVAIPGVMVAGFSFSSGNTQISTRLQQLSDDHYRGRVMALAQLAFNGVLPFATLSVSGLAQVIGLPITVALAAGILGVGGMTIWRRWAHKAYHTHEVDRIATEAMQDTR